jgi:hypothetical protein
VVKQAVKKTPKQSEADPDDFGDGPLKAEIGARIKEGLAESGGQRAFSAVSGEPIPTISKYVLGKREPKALFLRALNQHTGLSIDWVLTGEGPKKRYGTQAAMPFDPAVAQMAGEVVDFMDVGMRKRKRKPWSEEERQAMLDRVYRWLLNSAEG